MSPPTGSSAAPPAPSFVPPSAEELGVMLPQYEISHLIAAGGMGAVFAGLQRALDRPVAIKILPPDAAKDGESIGRFRTEAKAMARLIHPNIPAVYDFDVSGGYCYLVMEFIDGPNVHELINRKELTPALAFGLLSQVCDALKFAHQKGVVHGDIKPSNILVTKDGSVKLADFGLAQLAGARESEDFAPMGTPEYAAPELWQPGVVMDHRADLYSLGCVFYEMLTGAPPQGEFQLPGAALKLDPRVDTVITRCMEQKPEDRYQSAAEVKQALEAIQRAPQPATSARHAVPMVRPPAPRVPQGRKPIVPRASAPVTSARPAAPASVAPPSIAATASVTSAPSAVPRRPPVSAPTTRRRPKKKTDSPVPWMVAIGLIIIGVMLAFQHGGKSKTPPPPAPGPQTVAPAPALPPAPAPVKVSETPVPPPPPRPASPTPTSPSKPTAPALSSEAMQRLNAFRYKYRSEWHINVVEKRNAERDRLAALYTPALDKLREESANNGDAAALLAVRNEAERFSRNPGGVPDSQLSSIEKLATLQKTLTASFATLETRLKPAIEQVRERCLLELKPIETEAADADKATIGALYDKLVTAPDLELVLAN